MSIRSSLRKIHDAAPIGVQTFIRYLFNAIPPQWKFGPEFAEFKDQLLRNEEISNDQLLALQYRDLSQMLQHAFTYSPFHKSRLKEHGLSINQIQSIEDLRLLPIMERQDVREHFDSIKSINSAEFKPEGLLTGGTSGQPIHFLSDKRALVLEKACLFRHWYRSGYRPGDNFASIRGLRLKINPNKPTLQMGHETYVSSYHLSPTTLPYVLKQFKKRGVSLITSYANTVTFFCKLIDESGLPAPQIPRVIATSEMITDRDREIIKSTIGATVYDHFGMTELAGSASQCEKADGYHLATEMGVWEIVDENGNPCPPGVEGDLVVTGTRNFSFPWIRYRVGDRAIMSDKLCECGRPHPILSKVIGKIGDYLATKTGERITLSALNMHDHAWDNVRRFQFVQTEIEKVTVKIVPGAKFSDSDLEAIKRAINDKLFHYSVTYELVPEVLKTDRGKAPIIVKQFEHPN